MQGHSILGWLLIGLVAGALGKLVMPGKDPGGIVVTIVIGIAGALLGGVIAQWLGWGMDTQLRQYGAAVAAAVILLALYRIVMARRLR